MTLLIDKLIEDYDYKRRLFFIEIKEEGRDEEPLKKRAYFDTKGFNSFKLVPVCIQIFHLAIMAWCNDIDETMELQISMIKIEGYFQCDKGRSEN